MIFDCDGATYNTENLISHVSGAVTVYWTPDRSKVFLQTFNRWTGTEVRSVPPDQVRSLAQRYDIQALLE